MNDRRTLLWFRQDLRLADNPALHAAMARGAVIPVYLWTPQEEGDWPPGAASRWWLHHSLHALAADIAGRGGALLIRGIPVRGARMARGSRAPGALELLQGLLQETGADGVCWNRRYEPAALDRDRQVKSALRAAGVWAQSFNGALLKEPWEIQNQSGRPFQVFTPFWKRVLGELDTAEPLAVPPRWPADRSLPTAPADDAKQAIDALGLLPKIRWDAGMSEMWQPGEAGARARLDGFLAGPVAQYDTERDRPDIEGTSRLSPHLHHGEISPRQIWHAVAARAAARTRKGRGMGSSESSADIRHWRFITEIGWREFAHHLLYHFPHTPTRPLRQEFERFEWAEDPDGLRAWQRGLSGIPLVDAGMRQLWHEGWMHNRVRMVAASLLVKNLQIHWLEGARWFWETLVDADLASNTLGWQWVSGCGADAAPYFRVFNPETQRGRFDPQGGYVRRWVPEVEDPARYPGPIVNLQTSRNLALAAYGKLRRQ